MAARICSACDLAYPTSYGGLCRACDGTLRYAILDAETDDVFQVAAERRAAERFREADDPEQRIFANRLGRFVRAGLDYDTAVHLSGLKEADVNFFVVDVGRFERIVKQGCPPALAAKILG